MGSLLAVFTERFGLEIQIHRHGLAGSCTDHGYLY
jgi:hypothetical protein